MHTQGPIHSVKKAKDHLVIVIGELGGPVVRVELPKHTYPRAGDYIRVDAYHGTWYPRGGGTGRPLVVYDVPERRTIRQRTAHSRQGQGVIEAYYPAADRVRLLVSVEGCPGPLLMAVHNCPKARCVHPRDLLAWGPGGLLWQPRDRHGAALCPPQDLRPRGIDESDKIFYRDHVS